MGSVTASSVEYWLAVVIGLAELAGIISAFKFMFDIRKKAAAVHSD